MAEVFSISGASSGFGDDGGVNGFGWQMPRPSWQSSQRLQQMQRARMMHQARRPQSMYRQHSWNGGLGDFGACPAGFTTSAKGNCQGPAAAALQNALRALGKAVGGDTSLINLSADGSVGPATAAAVNRAFTVHIGAGQAPAAYRTGSLNIEEVAGNANALTALINTEITRRGGSLSPPSVSSGGGSSKPPSVVPSTASVVDEGPGLPTTTWALIGLAVLAAAGGAYVMFKPEPGRRR